MPFVVPEVPWTVLGPQIIVVGVALVVLVVDLFLPRERRAVLGIVTLAGLVGAALAVRALWGRTAYLLRDMVAVDGFSLFFDLLFLLVACLTVLMSTPYLRREGGLHGEYYVLLLLATLGMMLMAGSLDLIMIFLGLETLSIALYVLSGFLRDRLASNEAALKYLLLGAFASGFFLYGIALIYGAVGSTNLRPVAAALAKQTPAGNPLLFIGAGLLLVGLGFKVATVPFHMWLPDVYEGAPTSVTGFMIAGTKAAAFAALLRIFLLALPALQPSWGRALWVLAVLTMTVGNLVAIAQSNIKRMLAYSSIAHAGYLLVALTAGSALGGASLLFYLLAYALMNLGAFGVIIALGRRGEANLEITDYAGLGFRYPFLGLTMGLFMFALAGIPPTSGFMGKLYIFSAAVEAGDVWLAIIGVLNSVVSVYYYLRVTVVMYMRELPGQPPPLTLTAGVAVAVAVAALGTLELGLFPAGALELARRSVGALFG